MVASSVYYLHQDALGSTRLVVTTSVSIKFSSNYVPYGSNYAVSGKEVFMYTGKPYDSATGLYYFGARYYDASIGRFVTQDSSSGDKNDPMTMNLYIYARDNPERYVDPTGHVIAISRYCDGESCGSSGGYSYSGTGTSSAGSSCKLSPDACIGYGSDTGNPAIVVIGGPGGGAVTFVMGTTTWTIEANPREQGPGGATSAPTIGIGGAPLVGSQSVSLQVTPFQVPPAYQTFPYEVAHAGSDSVTIIVGSTYDYSQGRFSLGDALALGFDVGGIAATVLGVPEVGIPAIFFAGWIWDQFHPGGGL